MPQTITVIPSARRLMESLRDIGYELPAAVADLIDNSLDADATNVDLTVAFDGADSWIRVADDGTGMTSLRLNEAMRYGSERDYAEPDLGKFGLGMKTASMSQCRRLTVATRTNPERRDIEIRRWDLDHVVDEDRWELLRLTTSEVRPETIEPLREGVGTVVMWERLDRVLDYKLPHGVAAERGLETLCREIEEHLAMVFDRFLTGAARRRLPFSISVNGNPVDGWDPFARAERSTRRLPKQVLTLRYEGRSHKVVIHPYILPNQDQFATQRAWDAASGPKKWNRQQGFYFYRGGRMIQSGGWNRMRTPDEHTKLARIAVDIPRAADTAFELNVSKMRLIVPAEIRAELKTIASSVANQARTVYDKGGRRTGAGPTQAPGTSTLIPSAIPHPLTVAETPSDVPRSAITVQNTARNNATDGPLVAWKVVCDIVHEELRGQPEVLQRILDRLSAALFEDDTEAFGG